MWHGFHRDQSARSGDESDIPWNGPAAAEHSVPQYRGIHQGSSRQGQCECLYPRVAQAHEFDSQEQFKLQQYPQAAQLYTQSMVMSLNRPAWEQGSFVKDEISSALLNRSVAASKMGAWWVLRVVGMRPLLILL